MSDVKYFPRSGFILGPLWRSVVLLFVGSVIIGVSCTALFRSTNWAYDSNSGALHLLDCPKLGIALQRLELVDSGSFCEVQMYNWDYNIVRDYLSSPGTFGSGYNCWFPKFEWTVDKMEEFWEYASRVPVVCQVDKPCTQTRVCTVDQKTGPVVVPCPRGPEEARELSHVPGLSVMVSLGPASGFYIDWSKYADTKFTEYCDEEFKIQVGNIVAARGMIAALLLLVFAWLIVDFGIHFSGKAQQLAADLSEAEIKYNKTLAENIFPARNLTPPTTVRSSYTPRSFAGSPSGREGMVARTVTASPSCRGGSMTPSSFKVAVCQDPWRAFTSLNWRQKIEGFHHDKKLKPIHTRTSVAKMLFVPFSVICMGSLICWAYLALSPADLVNSHSVADVFLSEYSSVLRAYSTWIILPLLLLDELASLLLFFATAFVVRWGRTTVFANVKKQQELEETFSDLSESTSSLSSPRVARPELVPDGVVALVCIEERRMQDESKFISNIKSVIHVVGIEKIFIMQFSDSFAPLDDTVLFLQQHINVGIQYLFLPERDKLAATYWFSKYYLPLFQLHQPVGHRFGVSHVMVVDQCVLVPASLTIPHALIDSATLRKNGKTEKVGLICVAAVLEEETRLDNIDIKLEITKQVFQSDISSLGDSEFMGAPLTIWERESLEFAAFDHKPSTQSHGGDFPGAGLNLLKSGINNCVSETLKIKFISNCTVKVTTCENGSESSFEKFHRKLFLTFARKKRLWATDLASLLSPASVLNPNRIVSKPLNLVDVLANVFDFIRLPVLLSSALRDPIGLGFILVMFMTLQWLRIAVLSFTIIPSGSRKQRPAFFSALIYPVFHLVYNLCLLKPLSIMAAAVWSVNDRPAQSIHEREDHEKTIPPCLPFPDAPWFSVWKQPA